MSYNRRSTILDLKAEGVLKVWHDYRLGHTLDLSGNANHGVATAGVAFDRRGAKFTATGALIRVAYQAGIQPPINTTIVYGSFNRYANSDRLVSNGRTALANYLEFLLQTATLTLLDSAVATRTIAGTGYGRKCLGFSAVSGDIPIGYVDGISIGNFSGIVTLTASGEDCLIGDAFSGANSIDDHIGSVLICNRVLTPAEHLSVYKELAYP